VYEDDGMSEGYLGDAHAMTAVAVTASSSGGGDSSLCFTWAFATSGGAFDGMPAARSYTLRFLALGGGAAVSGYPTDTLPVRVAVDGAALAPVAKYARVAAATRYVGGGVVVALPPLKNGPGAQSTVEVCF